MHKIKFSIFFIAILINKFSWSYTYTFSNTTRHNVCVNPAGIGVSGNFLMQGKLKDIFNKDKKRNNFIDESGTIHVLNAGFQGKKGAECILPGRTAVLYFKDIDVGICYDPPNSLIGVKAEDIQKKEIKPSPLWYDEQKNYET